MEHPAEQKSLYYLQEAVVMVEIAVVEAVMTMEQNDQVAAMDTAEEVNRRSQHCTMVRLVG